MPHRAPVSVVPTGGLYLPGGRREGTEQVLVPRAGTRGRVRLAVCFPGVLSEERAHRYNPDRAQHTASPLLPYPAVPRSFWHAVPAPMHLGCCPPAGFPLRRPHALSTRPLGPSQQACACCWLSGQSCLLDERTARRHIYSLVKPPRPSPSPVLTHRRLQTLAQPSPNASAHRPQGFQRPQHRWLCQHTSGSRAGRAPGREASEPLQGACTQRGAGEIHR